jgi:hypothetical protein
MIPKGFGFHAFNSSTLLAAQYNILWFLCFQLWQQKEQVSFRSICRQRITKTDKWIDNYQINQLIKTIRRLVNLPICNDTAALMFPEAKQDLGVCDDSWQGVDHSLPNTRQVSQVEDVVEFCRRGQHLYLQVITVK